MKFFFTRVLFLLPLAILIPLINYTQDPANIFREGEAEREIAGIMHRGKNVATVTNNYNWRLLQQFYLADLTERPDIVAIGSSRCWQLRSSHFPGRKFFNSSVSRAGFEDYVAIYEMYRQKNLRPSVLILGLDPWLLNKANVQTQWTSVAGYYTPIARELGLTPPPEETVHEGQIRFSTLLPQKFSELFSLRYFQESFSFWWSKISHPERAQYGNYHPTPDTVSEENIVILSEGGISYPEKVRRQDSAQIFRLALNEGNNPFGMQKFYALDRDASENLAKFIRFLQKEGVRPVFFLSPYHTASYNIYIGSKQYNIIARVEQHYRQLAARLGIECIGSYNPAANQLGFMDFYDGAHPKPAALGKIFGKARF